MRVTNAGQTQAIIARLQTSAQRLEQSQQRVSSGRRVERMSEDPTAGTMLMQASGGLRGIAQYTRNAERVTGSLDAADSAMQQLSDLLGRAKELGVAANSANTSADARAAAAAEVRALFDQAISIGNTKLGDDFLFGGLTNDGRPPFDASGQGFVPTDVPTAGSPDGTPPVPRFPAGTRTVEVGAGGQRLLGAHDGTTVFLGRTADGTPDASTGLLPALRGLEQAMRAADPAGVGPALAALDTAFSTLQANIGELGARQNSADTARAGLQALDGALTEQKAGLSEVDAAEAITEMLARQSAYQAAMLASSKVMGMSLVDYLR
jgi:flagellar hook-associated protein 3 FlgL